MSQQLNKFEKGYQPSSNLVKDENGDLLADSHILSRCKNHFSQLLNVHRVHDVRQIEIVFAIKKLKKYKSPRSDRIPAELIQTAGETLQSGIRKLKHSIWSKHELPDRRKESIILLI
jgi:hypothetical protein